MAIQSGIVGQIQPPAPGPTFGQAVATQGLYEQAQAARQARIDAAADAAAASVALKEAQGSVPDAIDILMKSGKARPAETLQKSHDAHMGDLHKQVGQELDNQVKQAQIIAGLLEDVTDQGSLTAARGLVNPKFLQGVPDQFGDGSQIAAIRDAAKKAVGMSAAQKAGHDAYLASGKDADAKVASLMNFLGSDGITPEAWQGAVALASQEIPRAKLAQIPPTFSPQAQAFVRSASLTQPQRQAQANTATTQAATSARDANTNTNAIERNRIAAIQAAKPSGAAGPNMNTGATQIDARRPDPETGNKIIPGIGITPNAVYQGALSVALTGKQGVITSRAQAMQPAIAAMSNKAAAIAQAAGVDLPTLQSEWNASSGTIKNLTQRYQLLAASATTANENIDYARDLSAKVDRTSIPKFNRFKQWLQSEIGGSSLPDLSAFELAIYTASREYAKVVSGSAASIAELSVSAAQKADQLINTAQTPAQFQKVTEVMQGDMGRVTAPLLSTIKGTPDLGDHTRRFLEFISQGVKAQTNAKDPFGIR